MSGRQPEPGDRPGRAHGRAVQAVIPVCALDRFNNRPAQYVHPARLAAMERIDDTEMIRSLLARERIERRLSQRILARMNCRPATLADFDGRHAALALEDFDVMRRVCLLASARRFTAEIRLLVDGTVIREVIELLGEPCFRSLREAGPSGPARTLPPAALAQEIRRRAKNYLAGWLIAQPEPIRKRAVLKTPPGVRTSVFVGDLQELAVEITASLNEARHA
ncbi:MAG: Yop proteins translocation protein K [Kiloniellales bacterium]|nr:Yop proteins translocation protein K [Kiloniellales bacterium]